MSQQSATLKDTGGDRFRVTRIEGEGGACR